MKTTNVKQSKKNSGWLLALPHEDEKGFEALAYLRKKGYFNTRLYRLNKNKSQKQITRYYLRYPQAEAYETWLKNGNGSIEAQAKRDIWKLERLNARLERQVADLTNKDYEEEIFIRENLLANLEPENERLKQRVAQLEAENAKLRSECMDEDGLYDNEDVERILKSSKYGSWVKTANADEYPKLHTPNLNFVTPDMSATLGRGTHVMIDIDKVPKDLQVLLAKMMDALNDHTLRISRLENC